MANKLRFLFVFFGLVANVVQAHYDGEVRPRHWYSVQASTHAYYAPATTPFAACQEYIDLGYAATGYTAYTMCECSIDVALDHWRVVHPLTTFGNCGGSLTSTYMFPANEWHCDYDEIAEIDSVDNCVPATHNCAALKNSTVNWLTNKAPSGAYGLNVPQGLNAPFDVAGGCSAWINNWTATANPGEYTIAITYTGGLEIDEDGKPEMHNDHSGTWDNCVPNELQEGGIVNTWGGAPCGPFTDADGDNNQDLTDQCPDTPAGEAVDSNGCGCETQGGSCGGGQTVDMTGVEQRLDTIISQNQTAETARTAANESLDQMEGDLEELRQLAILDGEVQEQQREILEDIERGLCQPDPDTGFIDADCNQTLPSLGSVDTIGASATDLWNRVSNAPVIQAIAAIDTTFPAGACPNFTTDPIEPLGDEVLVFDTQCAIWAEIASTVHAFMLIVWSLIGVGIFLRA